MAGSGLKTPVAHVMRDMDMHFACPSTSDVLLRREDWLVIRAALTASEKDAARWRYARGKIMWGRHGPCLACGLTKADAAETDRNIDAAMEKANG